MHNTVTPRPQRAKRLIFAASFLPLIATLSNAAAVNDSYLVASANAKISDATFANIMSSALIKGGQPNVLEASFLFNTCYGGGMIDNLSDKLGPVPWMAASASAPNEQSTGQLTVAEANKANASLGPADRYPTNGTSIQVSNTPGDFWTSALIPELGKNQPLLQAANNAGNNDPMGANPKAPNFLRTFEHAQSSSANGGDKIVLTDPNATAYDAILWAGNPNRARHGNDITGVFNALTTAWKGKTSNILVLYGNGSVSAPKGVPWSASVASQLTLVNTLNNFKLNNQTEFLFYATDHGSGSKVLKTNKSKVTKNDSDEEDFSLDPITVSDIDTDEVFAQEDGPASGFSPFMPYVEIDYDGVAEDNTVGVFAGSDFLGYLPTADTVMDFNIPYSDVGAADSITVVNGSSADFNLDYEEFDTGDQAEDAPAPEPTMLALGSLGTMAMLGARRRRRN